MAYIQTHNHKFIHNNIITGALKKFLQTEEKWFDELNSTEHFDEKTLQRIIIYKIKEHLPSYDVIYYDRDIAPSINNPIGLKRPRKPDFLMWKRDYTEWYVIEVELEDHSIKHIEEQLGTFYYADYVSDVDNMVEYISKKNKEINIDTFKKLIVSTTPKIMLIADHIKHDWKNSFSTYNCIFASLQVYSDGYETFMYRLSGDWPQDVTSFTYCTLDKVLPMLKISKPDFFQNTNYQDGDLVELYYENIKYTWKYIIDLNPCLVYTGNGIPIDLTQKRWTIIKNSKGQLHLKK